MFATKANYQPDKRGQTMKVILWATIHIKRKGKNFRWGKRRKRIFERKRG
jgi:hypothetical protein